MGYSTSLHGIDFLEWLQTAPDKRKKKTFGNLRFENGAVFSYRMQIARVYDDFKVVLVDSKANGKVSRTTSSHYGSVWNAKHFYHPPRATERGRAASHASLTWTFIEVPGQLLQADFRSVVAHLWAKPRFKDMSGVLNFFRILERKFSYNGWSTTRPLLAHRDFQADMVAYIKANKVTRDSMQAIAELSLEAQHE